MYICICIYVYVNVYVSAHVSIYICVYVHVYICICVCMYICMYVFIYVCMCMCVYVYTFCLTFLQTEVLSILRWRDATWRKAGSKMNGHWICAYNTPANQFLERYIRPSISKSKIRYQPETRTRPLWQILPVALHSKRPTNRKVWKWQFGFAKHNCVWIRAPWQGCGLSTSIINHMGLTTI